MEQQHILILGAGGQIARHAIGFLKGRKNTHLTLFLRDGAQVKGFAGPNVRIVEGDVLQEKALDAAMQGQDLVYANLAGPVDRMAKAIVAAMEANGVKRLIFIAALGIHDEIPGAFGRWNKEMIGADLVRYSKAAATIEASGLDYTIIRPAWLTDNEEVAYELTRKGEPFKGTEVSRKSVGAYVAELVAHPDKDVRASIGIDKPGTDGDKPSFY
ncbi:MAG: SDR family oxidoreductase [Bacteroidetes bacterium]|nr:SDR family oxidoreductase [Bacteroidota bacterium]